MSKNENLKSAKKNKNDEFYTRYEDIEKELNAYIEYNPEVFKNKTILLPCDDPEWSNFTKYFVANFGRLGIKKLISTSYAKSAGSQNTSDYEKQSPNYDSTKSRTNGKVFFMDHADKNKRNAENLDFYYLRGDGDFRSDEVQKLCEESDIIITNPPFSLFREFLAWILRNKKKFIIIGNMNAIACKEIFPLIKSNQIWSGTKNFGGGMNMIQPKEIFDEKKTKSFKIDKDGNIIKNIMGVIWFTNIDHGKRHESLELMTMADNRRYNKKIQKSETAYCKYDNYDAIEVPVVEAIPSDYEGVMGVPITFLDKYNPEQFEILGCSQRGCHDLFPDTKKYNDYKEMKPNGEPTGASGNKTNENPNIAKNDGEHNYFVNMCGHEVQSCYNRIFIRKKSE